MARKPASPPPHDPASSQSPGTPSTDHVVLAEAEAASSSLADGDATLASTEVAAPQSVPDANAEVIRPVSGDVSDAPDTITSSIPEGGAIAGMDASNSAVADTITQTAAAAALSEDPPEIALQASIVVVIGPAKGRWRAGRHFTAEPTKIRINELSETDLVALQADPVLNVSIVAAPN